MHKSLLEDIKQFFISGNMISKLILVNIAFLVLIIIINVLFGSKGINIESYFLLSNDVIWDLKHPWVFLTYLFISKSLFQLIWNMFILYWFGAILGDMVGDKKILPVYILGGLLGAVFFITISYILRFSPCSISGVETSVISIIIASAVLVPNYNMRLLIFGNVSLKIITVIYVLVAILYSLSSYNKVYLSLMGGIVFGWYYIYSLRHGRGLDDWFNKWYGYFKKVLFLFKGKQKSNLTVKYKSNNIFSEKNYEEQKHKKELDRILDKIKKEGYDKLTEGEKEFLFIASNRK